MEQEIISVLQNVGFPGLAFVLMYRLTDTTIKENTQAINGVKEALVRLCVEHENKEG